MPEPVGVAALAAGRLRLRVRVARLVPAAQIDDLYFTRRLPRCGRRPWARDASAIIPRITW